MFTFDEQIKCFQTLLALIEIKSIYQLHLLAQVKTSNKLLFYTVTLPFLCSNHQYRTNLCMHVSAPAVRLN